MDINKDDYFTIVEVANRLRYSTKTIRRWIKEKRLEGIRPSRKILISKQSVFDFEAEHRINAGVPNA